MAHEAFEVFYRTRNEVTLYDDVLPALERDLARVHRGVGYGTFAAMTVGAITLTF